MLIIEAQSYIRHNRNPRKSFLNSVNNMSLNLQIEYLDMDLQVKLNCEKGNQFEVLVGHFTSRSGILLLVKNSKLQAHYHRLDQTVPMGLI